MSATATDGPLLIEHFPGDRLIVIHFGYGQWSIPHTYNDWDWYAMRRGVRFHFTEQEEQHLALIQLTRFERQLQDRQIREWAQSKAVLPRWLVLALFLLGVAGFWWLAMVGCLSVFGLRVSQ